MYSLVVRGFSFRTKNFVGFYVNAPMTGNIGLKDGRSSVTVLWTLRQHT